MFLKAYIYIYVKVSQLITDFDSTFARFVNFLICCSSLVALKQAEHKNIGEYAEESSLTLEFDIIRSVVSAIQTQRGELG